ncbi:MAG: ATP-binding protein [Candidatus Pacebacteria bacterium]|nr:ATP-binding protein [Candidatus Paceibacterota bacterium]
MDITFYFIATFLIVVVELSFATAMMLEGKRTLTRAFATFLFLHTIWLSAEAVFHETTSGEVANLLIPFLHYFGGVVASVFFYFVVVFSNEIKTIYTFGDSFLQKKRVLVGLVLFDIFLLPLYASGLIVGNAYKTTTIPEFWGWSQGQLWFISPLVFALFFGAGLFRIYSKYVGSNGKVRRNLGIIFWGVLISILPVFIFSVVLPFFFNFFNFSWIGPITTFALSFVLMFAIVEHYETAISAFVTKIIIFASTAILFVNIFIRDVTAKDTFFSPEGVLRAAVFLSFFFVGYVIVSNILRETEQKEKIEKVNKELTLVNAELEEKVKERELKLNVSKKHIEAILQNITMGIIEYSSSFLILQLNEAAERLLGVNKEDVVGKTILGVERSGILSSFSQVIYDGKTSAVSKEDLRGITYNEINVEYPKKRILQISTIPIRKGGSIKISGFVKLLRDITRERDIDREKSNFIAIVAHQLNAPLEAIEWSLEKILSDEKLERPKEMLNRIRSSNENLIQITTDLLNTSRIDNGEFNMKLESSSLENVLIELVNHFKKSAEKKNIALLLENDGEPVPNFLFDAEKIRLAIRNIIHNAIDYTPVKGSVTVTLKGGTPGYAIVTVQDSGIGIPKEEEERLFTKFYRSKKALLMETDRSGLGLYITKYIVDCHQGTIRVDSSDGMGAKVEIKLPLNVKNSQG